MTTPLLIPNSFPIPPLISDRSRGGNITHVFFCTRDPVEFESRQQFKDFTAANAATKEDQEVLETWLGYVNQGIKGRGRMGPEMFKFSTLKYVDPAYD